jgi:hypothetical protein
MSAILYLAGILIFFGIWIYAFISWGFLIGLAIGWLPALIANLIIFNIANLFN